MGSEIQRLRSLRQKLANATAELNVQDTRKKELHKQLKALGVIDISDVPKMIDKKRKTQESLKTKLDKALGKLENEFSDLQA